MSNKAENASLEHMLEDEASGPSDTHTASPMQTEPHRGNGESHEVLRTLNDLNRNMASMADTLASFMSAHTAQGVKASRKRKTAPPENTLSSSDDDKEGAKGPKRRDQADRLSHIVEDKEIKEFLKSTQPYLNEGNPNENVPDPGEDAFFDALEADIEDEEAVCEAVNDRIPKIAKKLWGSSIAADRLKTLLAKHAKPQNCHEITVPRVNPEIWAKMPGFKRTLQKATFSILQCCDSLLKQTKKADTTDNLLKAIDAIRLVGHGMAELSHVRREQIKPVLNKEFASLCAKPGPDQDKCSMLFGEDLAKQIRDAKEMNSI
ncbi:predicted protein [Nematostella vectensis]|uniref:Uncharacterized protein n=1 Tax=Nematostella vectensis TaxID=45351 RepID=A7SAW8_NEMVE|nr:predicted protein [Nematostella vectensis]EDO39156.1 predicted protein [Nematostella vectensis]|eukprot:XP_001631217.1 predicted protein [Nematostella vectensis]